MQYAVALTQQNTLSRFYNFATRCHRGAIKQHVLSFLHTTHHNCATDTTKMNTTTQCQVVLSTPCQCDVRHVLCNVVLRTVLTRQRVVYSRTRTTACLCKMVVARLYGTPNSQKRANHSFTVDKIRLTVVN